ncbi:MmgE/PrpD family protein [Paraburkholderia diazotrophica]|uniref:2-methylcitrate dehydratase PrpD n=1 Tax=Paraburkholderia diazotrophica TaxID=667676 RepID=A0A1H7EHS3_9BURK|nr:MmgE/PrpD family protein [Paraburkholderia diazotrophica]SEK13469.1 2-methylcitrate dehydratase PrpD [Paraburkholderia diazotrophica]
MNRLSDSTVGLLARYVCSLKSSDIPGKTKKHAGMCVLDTLAAAVAGLHAPSVVAAREASMTLFGNGEIPLWFDGRRTTTAGAIFANSSAAAVLDMDDGHSEARGHPAAAVVPAVLNLAVEIGASADDVLSAIAIGYEVGIRIKAARGDHGQKGWNGQSGVWTGFCVAAATGWLLKASQDQIANSIALAAVYSPNLVATSYTKELGADVKEGIPLSAVVGYSSMILARLGHAGFTDTLDHPPFYDAALILRGLGEEEMKINGNYFKPYATCRHFHAALSALETMMADHNINASDITAIKVHIYDYALRLSNKTRPENLTDIQYSIPYCMAIVAILGADPLMPIDDSLLGRPELVALAEKVEIIPDPEYSAKYPRIALNRVEVVTAGETYSSPTMRPPCDPDAPMSMEQLERKFRTASREVLHARQQEDLLHAFTCLLNGEIAPLLETIAKPARIDA